MATMQPFCIPSRNGFSYFFYLQVAPILSTKFESIGHLVKVKKFKIIDLQDIGPGGHLGFLIRTILANFNLCWYFLLSFESTGLSVQEEKDKTGF